MTALPAWVRRLVLGPTDQEISARSQALGGPPYPIPRTDPRPPTYPQAADRFFQAAESGMPWDEVARQIERKRQAADTDQKVIAEQVIGPNLTDRPDIMPAYPPSPTTGRLPITRAYPPKPRNEEPVTDPTPTGKTVSYPILSPTPQSMAEALANYDLGRDAAIQQQPASDAALIEHVRHHHDRKLAARCVDITSDPNPDPVTDSGVHAIPDRSQRTIGVPCPTCKGLGHMDRTVSELLRESIALIPPDGGQHVIREFYRRLFAAAPDLAALFPPDLITAAADDTVSPGRLQRDKLLQALAALADLYGTTPAERQRLDTALRAYGRHHAAFARPDGTTRGATIEEYLAVKQALMDTLHTAAGAAWLPAYGTAWAEAYDYAMVIMLHEQMTSGMAFPRQPRAAMPSPRPANA